MTSSCNASTFFEESCILEMRQREAGLVWDSLHSIAEAAFLLQESGLRDEAACLAYGMAKLAPEAFTYYLWLRDRWPLLRSPGTQLPGRVRGDSGKILTGAANSGQVEQILLMTWVIAKNLSVYRQMASESTLAIGDRLGRGLLSCGNTWLRKYLASLGFQVAEATTARHVRNDEMDVDARDMQLALEAGFDVPRALATEPLPLRRGLARAVGAVATVTDSLAKMVAEDIHLLETALEPDMPRKNLSLLLLSSSVGWETNSKILVRAFALLGLGFPKSADDGRLVRTVLRGRQLEAYILRRVGLTDMDRNLVNAASGFVITREYVAKTVPSDSCFLMGAAVIDKLQAFADIDLPTTDELLASMLALATELVAHRDSGQPRDSGLALEELGVSAKKAGWLRAMLLRGLPASISAFSESYVSSKEDVLMRDWLRSAGLVL